MRPGDAEIGREGPSATNRPAITASTRTARSRDGVAPRLAGDRSLSAMFLTDFDRYDRSAGEIIDETK